MSTMTQIFAFLLGVFGEILVTRVIGKIMLWWETEVSEEMKAKCDTEYDRLFKESQDLGNPDPPA